MSTPPPLPNDTLEHSPRPPKRSILEKFTIVLTVILCVTFGLCTVTITSSKVMSDAIIKTSIAIEALCILGLFAIAIIVIFRALRGDY